VSHHHPARVARQAAGRFRGDVGAVLEDRLTRCLGVRENRSIDVDHDLVSFRGCARIDAMVERRLSEKRQRIRLLLGHRRRFCGSVRRKRFRGTHHVAIATPRPAETSYASRVEGPEVGHVNGANKARRGT